MATGIRRPGDFCWINMLTPETAKARAFFSAVLGWTYGEIPGMGHSVKVGGHDIGGLFDTVSPRTPNGTAPIIGVMLKTESADATVSKVTTLGGKAESAFDVGDSGRMTVCHDPNSANFDMWEPRKSAGMDVDSALHGAPSWFETMTTDVERAANFYSALFGWTRQDMPMPGGQYTMFANGAEPVAGMMKIAPNMGAMRSHWATYFTVDNADETSHNAVKLGAQICFEMKEAPRVGRFCGFTSPQGVPFNIIQYAR
jgi:hypothetical protein